MAKTVYLSLGSNIGDREASLREAIAKLPEAGVRVLRVSPVYETEPLEYTAQAWFLNLAVEGETDLFPMQLLSRTTRLERALGRTRTIAKGPRTIDIDILFYGRAIVKTSRLEIPHPRIADRRFVLAPLCDLSPALRHPGTQKTVREMLAAAPSQIVRALVSHPHSRQ